MAELTVPAAPAAPALPRRYLYPLVALMVSVALLAGSSAYFFVANNERAAEGRQAHDAICALRADLVNRVAAGRAFLAEHPQGIPGIPAATLQTSIDGQVKTIAALSEVDCN